MKITGKSLRTCRKESYGKVTASQEASQEGDTGKTHCVAEGKVTASQEGDTGKVIASQEGDTVGDSLGDAPALVKGGESEAASGLLGLPDAEGKGTVSARSLLVRSAICNIGNRLATLRCVDNASRCKP